MSTHGKEGGRYPSHPLLEPGVSSDWNMIAQIIAPDYEKLTHMALHGSVSFHSSLYLKAESGILGSAGSVVSPSHAVVERLKDNSPKSYATFYSQIFHELQHIDDEQTGFEKFSVILAQHGFYDRYTSGQLQKMYNSLFPIHPENATHIEQYFSTERMITESRAELFALVLGERIFSGHPLSRNIALKVRSELLSGLEIYTGGNNPFDIGLDRNILALFAITENETLEDAWKMLELPLNKISTIAMKKLIQIQEFGFRNAILRPVNEVFAQNYGLSPYKFQYLWSGTPQEIESISIPGHVLYERFVYTSQPDAYKETMKAVTYASRLFGS